MCISRVVRYVAPLAVAVLVSGCFSGPSGSTAAYDPVMERRDDCRWNRSSCIYEGSYESGEADYAVEEARRLNRASIERLRRGAWR